VSYSDEERRQYRESAQAAESLAVEQFLSQAGEEPFSVDELVAAVDSPKFDTVSAVQLLKSLHQDGTVAPVAGNWAVVSTDESGPFFHVRIAPVDARDLLSGPLYAFDLSERELIETFIAPYQSESPVQHGDRRLEHYRAPKITRTNISGQQTVDTIRERLKRSSFSHSAHQAEENFFEKASQDVTDDYLAGPPGTVDARANPGHAVAAAPPAEEGDGRQVGPWKLGEKLGEGGNAIVWRATHEDDPERVVALKVLKTKKPDREPYKRFVQEIKTLQEIGEYPGVLPVIEAYLPEKPSKTDRPWLAMEEARLIREALAGQLPEVVVEAIASVAETLARLKAEHELGHRDLKPGNLYELNGDWLVGDFGLIDVPDADELTRTNRPLGPVHYTAYEMLNDPANADPFPADVYSLAKTLWVLVTGQNYPVEGHQRADQPKYSIADLRPHRFSASLDRLVDRSTLLDPEARPSMEEFATELRACLAITEDESGFDLGDVGAEIRRRLASELSGQDLLEYRVGAFTSAVQRFIDLTQSIDDGLRQVHPRAEIGIPPDKFVENVLSTPLETGRPEIVRDWRRLSQLSSGPEYDLFVLRVGRGLELTSDGDLICRTVVDVGDPDTNRTDYMFRSNDRVAPVGSAEAEQMLQEATKELGEETKKALQAFLEGLPNEDDSGRPAAD
jgi:serine/threonine protein kinase